MIQDDFEKLLQEAMGLDAASIGSSAVARAVLTRMSAGGTKELHAYGKFVRTSAAELQALIEAVIVPETWFFRDREAFVELARVANGDWLPACPEGTLRLLSLPCSSGEEPYSMAMALLDAGFPINRCRIDAIDISTQGLSHGQHALYGRNSFRGADLSFRDRFFETTALGSRLSDVVRQQVHFQQGNMLAGNFLPGEEIYDIIFCRNLLIYFDRATQDRAVEVLMRLLKPKGVLFLGPSEGGLLLNHGFVSSKVPLAFAFRRRGAGPSASAPARPQLKPSSPFDVHKSSLARPLKTNKPPVRPNRAAEPPPATGPAQTEALSLADQGHMAEAAKSCEEQLRKHGPSVQSFFLMGLIRASAGSLSEAGEFYRKALYLDQNHHDTLIHLGLLLEKQGDAAGAQVLHNRLQRLQRKRTV